MDTKPVTNMEFLKNKKNKRFYITFVHNNKVVGTISKIKVHPHRVVCDYNSLTYGNLFTDVVYPDTVVNMWILIPCNEISDLLYGAV